MPDVFISHVEEDAPAALEIAGALEAAGYSTWCYERDLIPGPSFLVQTGTAVEGSRAVLVLISRHSLGSRQVTAEVVRGHESGKPFIPVLVGISHVEFVSRQPEWREAMAAATSVMVPREGPGAIVSRIVAGLRALGVEASRTAFERSAAAPLVAPRHRTTRWSRAGLPPWQKAALAAVVLVLLGVAVALVARALSSDEPGGLGKAATTGPLRIDVGDAVVTDARLADEYYGVVRLVYDGPPDAVV